MKDIARQVLKIFLIQLAAVAALTLLIAYIYWITELDGVMSTILGWLPILAANAGFLTWLDRN